MPMALDDDSPGRHGRGLSRPSTPLMSRQVSRRGCHERRLPTFPKDDVRGARCGNVLGALIAELRQVDSSEKAFSGAEEDGGNGKVQFVDQSGAEILLDGSDSPAEADVLTIGGL